MKKIVTLLFFILLSHSSFSQVWKQLTSVNAQLNRCASFSIGDTGYIFGGDYFGNGPDMWAYDTALHTWTQVTSYPSDYVDGVVAASLNGVGYAGTGAYCCYDFGNSFYQYVPNTGGGTWTQLPDFPGPGRSYGVAFTLDGKVYVGGGLFNYYGQYITPYNDFFVYDPVHGTWDSIAPCPASGVSCCPVAFVIGDTVYVGSGAKINSSLEQIPQNDFWRYDTTSKVWTQIASIPGVRAEASAFATCDGGFVGLGYIDSTQSTCANSFWRYDPYKNTWTQIANFGGAARHGALSFTIGKTGYVVGGSPPSGPVLEDLWSFTPIAIPGFTVDTNAVCQGGTITFTDTSNYGPTSWNWSFPGGTPDTSNASNPVVTYNDTGTYSVTLTAFNSCDSGTQTVTNYITVNSGGSLTVVPPSPSVPCGQSVTLNVTTTGTSFKWTPSTGLNGTTSDTVLAAPTMTTVYSVTGAGTGGCAFSGIDTVKVIPPLPFIILPLDTAFCSSQSAILYVSGGGSEFIWTPISGITDSTKSGDSVTVSPTATTTYMLTGNNSGGCATSGTDMVTIIPSPGTPTFTRVGDTLISSSVHDNQWYRNDTLLKNDTSQYLITHTPGEYYVEVINEVNGCSTASDSAYTGIQQLASISNELSIYPNPFNDNIVVKINTSAVDISNWNLEVIDELGRTVYTRLSLQYSNDIDLSDLPGGVYFLMVMNKEGKAVMPIVKQN